MRKIWVVIRREFLEKVRTKWFIISTVMGPLLMVGFIAVSIFMAEGGAVRRVIAIVDLSSANFGQQLAVMLNAPEQWDVSRLQAGEEDLERVADSLTAVVGREELDGYLIMTDDAVETGRLEYRGSNVSSLADMEMLQRLLQQSLLIARLDRVGVDPRLVSEAQIPVRMRTVNIRDGQETEESAESVFILAYVMWIALYIAILLYGLQVMGSVVEEKTTRVVEVLISSLKPFQLLAGKVIGVGAVGLFQLLIWGLAGWVIIMRRDVVLEAFGVEATTAQAIPLPDVSLATGVIFLSYFLLGYFLYAAMFAAVAAMSNSEAEARQAQTPVVMLFVIPSILMIGILQQPGGSMAVAFSLIPFTAPIAMPVRWAGTAVPFYELMGSIVFLVAALCLVTWVAARIYRVGILMYGKRPGLKELVRWVRAG
jgi:ABC-2 type transport system permease protein